MERKIHEMLLAYDNSKAVRMHMPGHKGQVKYDVTEILETDNLEQPSGAILETNQKIAQIYGMEFATLCTCGSSAAILAMLLCVDGKILIGRNAHKSCINGVMLFDLEAEFFEDVSTNGYLLAIEKSDAKFVYVTYPDYYGRCVDIEKICRAAHEKGKIVLVDCAHGAHFDFSEKLPKLPKAADMFCVSAHKTLPFALTQGAVLFSKNQFSKKLLKNLFMVHTTSPSFLIMESIEHGVCFMEQEKVLIEKWIDKCEIARKTLDVEFAGGEFQQDLTRLTFSVEGYCGFELEAYYREHGIIAEMADNKNVVMITSPIDLDAIDQLVSLPLPTKKAKKQIDYKIITGISALSIREIKGKSSERVLLNDAVGRISASSLGVYPPGIANVLPGEIITGQIVDYFNEIMQSKAQIFGMENGYVYCI